MRFAYNQDGVFVSAAQVPRTAEGAGIGVFSCLCCKKVVYLRANQFRHTPGTADQCDRTYAAPLRALETYHQQAPSVAMAQLATIWQRLISDYTSTGACVDARGVLDLSSWLEPEPAPEPAPVEPFMDDDDLDVTEVPCDPAGRFKAVCIGVTEPFRSRAGTPMRMITFRLADGREKRLPRTLRPGSNPQDRTISKLQELGRALGAEHNHAKGSLRLTFDRWLNVPCYVVIGATGDIVAVEPDGPSRVKG